MTRHIEGLALWPNGTVMAEYSPMSGQTRMLAGLVWGLRKILHTKGLSQQRISSTTEMWQESRKEKHSEWRSLVALNSCDILIKNNYRLSIPWDSSI